jgi:hypothetical protein
MDQIRDPRGKISESGSDDSSDHFCNLKRRNLQRLGKPDTAFNISAKARLKIPARMTSLQTRNEKASLRITPCAARRSHFYRAKFIP